MRQYIQYRIKLAQEMDAQANSEMYNPPAPAAAPSTPEEVAAKRRQFYKKLLGYGLVTGGGYVAGASASAGLAELLSRASATSGVRSLQAADKLRKFGPYVGLATGATGLATALMWANVKRKAEEDSGYVPPPPTPAPMPQGGGYGMPMRAATVNIPTMNLSRIYNKMRSGRTREAIMGTVMEEPKPEELVGR